MQLEYRNANVIDFGNEIDLGDLQLSKADIDGGDAIVLPRSRDIRITIYPVCSDKPPEYFGFAKTRIDDELYLVGEPFEFFVREDTEDEDHFFKPGLESAAAAGPLSAARSPAGEQPAHARREHRRRQRAAAEHADGADRLAASRGLQGPDAHRQAGRAHSIRVQQPDPAHACARQFVAHVRDIGGAAWPLAVRAVVRGAARLDVGRPGRPGHRGSPRAAVHRRSGDRRRRGRGLRAVAEDARAGWPRPIPIAATRALSSWTRSSRRRTLEGRDRRSTRFRTRSTCRTR